MSEHETTRLPCTRRQSIVYTSGATQWQTGWLVATDDVDVNDVLTTCYSAANCQNRRKNDLPKSFF